MTRCRYETLSKLSFKQNRLIMFSKSSSPVWKNKPLIKQPYLSETVKIGCGVCKSLILRKKLQKSFRGHLCQKIKNEAGDKEKAPFKCQSFQCGNSGTNST